MLSVPIGTCKHLSRRGDFRRSWIAIRGESLPIGPFLCAIGVRGLLDESSVFNPVACRARGAATWFPNNVARNSHVNLSNVEIGSLELQRLWVLLKVQAIELRATFGAARWLGVARGRGG